MRPVLLSIGHGYSAAALAARLGADWRRIGTTRSATRAAAMRIAGVEPVDANDAAAVEQAIAQATHVVVSRPPEGPEEPTLARFGPALARRGPEWIGYLSTTGVYGDRAGGWVDEESPLEPVNARSRWRLAAERAWTEGQRNVELFRLAGIYGPGRSVFDRLRAGRAQRIVKPGQVFSRIHVEDIAAVLAAAIARPEPGAAWNVADDEPAPPQDVTAYAAKLAGLPVPPEITFAEADLSPMARSFYSESKRVSNRRIKARLGARLAYPDYRAGLAAVLAAGG